MFYNFIEYFHITLDMSDRGNLIPRDIIKGYGIVNRIVSRVIGFHPFF